jgi:hypothetical protein
VGSHFHNKFPEKSNTASIPYLLQLQVGAHRATSSHQLLTLQACQGRDPKDKVAEHKRLEWEECSTSLQLYPSQWCYATTQEQHKPQLPSVAQACPAKVAENE